MIAWFARHGVAANLLMASLLLAGMVALLTAIPLEIFPDFSQDIVTVDVSLRGATPVDVESGVAIRIEEAVQDLEGIERLTSRSIEGAATVSIEVESGYDPRRILEDVKARVDALNTLPLAAERPVIRLAERKREVISVAIAGDFGERELRENAERVRDELLRLPGITQAVLAGVRAYEVVIEVSRDALRDYGLTLGDISDAVAASSLDLSAGNLRAEGGDVLVSSRGQAYRRDDFEQIVVKTNPDGTIVRIADIARVRDGFEESPVRTRFNGEPAAMVDVYRVGQQNAIEVADEVRGYIEARRGDLPAGLTLDFYDDDSRIVKSRLRTLTGNAVQGGLLVILLLALFLKPAIAFWVFVGIPVSFMGAFVVMALVGVSINVLSLFGFILVLGIVVDDAIVTGENVYTHLKRGGRGIDAVIAGTKEVALPVTFGILTTVAAFLPLAFLDGNRAVLFAQIPVVVIPVLIFSLIESKFVLPAHLKHVRLQPNGGRLDRWQSAFADAFEGAILRFYAPSLEVCLKHRYVTLAVLAALLIVVGAAVFSSWTRFVFFPRVEGETARATLVMPVGTPFEVTDRHIERMAAAAQALKERYGVGDDGASIITNVFATTGSGGRSSGNGSHLGQVQFQVVAPERRGEPIRISTLVNEWRRAIGAVPGAESLTFRAEIGRGGEPVDVQLSGQDLEELEAIAARVKRHLAGYPGVFDVADSLAEGKQELNIQLNETGHALGLTRASVVRQVRQAYIGAEAQRIQRGRDDVRVFVRLPLAERQALSELENLYIRTPGGLDVPLATIAQLRPGHSPSTITRVGRYRTVNVTADVDKGAVDMSLLQSGVGAFLDELLQQYPGTSYSFEGEAREQRESFASLRIGLVALVFVIYALLAVPLNSYIQPLIVMSVIPFATIGAVAGHWLLGMDLTIMSVFGMLALAGVVVNDSLVLVRFVNDRRDAGETLEVAVRAAGVSRFRAVILTSLTTFMGLAPLLLEKATQAQFLIPMAVSLAFGIIFATIITLLLVPVNYLVLEDLRKLTRRERVQDSQVA